MDNFVLFLIGLGIFILVSIIIIIIIKLTNNKSSNDKSTDNKSTSDKLPEEDCTLSEWSDCYNLNQRRIIIKTSLGDESKCPVLNKSCDNYKISNDTITVYQKYYRLGLKTPIVVNHIINVFNTIISSIHSINYSIIRTRIEINNPIILIGNYLGEFSVFDPEKFRNVSGKDYFPPYLSYPGFINIKYNKCSEENNKILMNVILNIIYYIGFTDDIKLNISNLFKKYHSYYSTSFENPFEFFYYFYFLYFNLINNFIITAKDVTMTRDIMENSKDLWEFYSVMFDIDQRDAIIKLVC
jgi:hypothetical protein